MARVHLHSGGIEPVQVRAGTGGRKPSQWRTENKPSVRPKPAKKTCPRCTHDQQVVEKAEAVFKHHKQPPLHSRVPVEAGAPGSRLRPKAQAAAARLAACACQRTTTPTPKKTVKAPARRTVTPARSVRSTDPYQQVLAHDQQKVAGSKRKRR